MVVRIRTNGVHLTGAGVRVAGTCTAHIGQLGDVVVRPLQGNDNKQMPAKLVAQRQLVD